MYVSECECVTGATGGGGGECNDSVSLYSEDIAHTCLCKQITSPSATTMAIHLPSPSFSRHYSLWLFVCVYV